MQRDCNGGRIPVVKIKKKIREIVHLNLIFDIFVKVDFFKDSNSTFMTRPIITKHRGRGLEESNSLH